LRPFIIMIAACAIQLFALFMSYSGTTPELVRCCLVALPNFLALLVSSFLFLLYPFIMSFVQFRSFSKVSR
jgi:hypothetical protein